MERVTCHYCGLPFKVRRVDSVRGNFCCTGCAMLSRIPVDEKGQFPVNAHLVSALVTGFVFFNQLLFWLVAELLVREGRMTLALRFYWFSGGAALAVWLALLVMQRRERTWRLGEGLVMAAGLAGIAVACRRFPPMPFELALIGLTLIAWNFRGLLRKSVRR